MRKMKEVKDFTVVSKIFINEDTFELELQLSTPLLSICPGQFSELQIEHCPATLLRRPFSIHNVDYERNILSFLIRICGNGSKKLSALQTGDAVNLIYPLGNGFTIEKGNYLLVGGGSGIAPLYFLARCLNKLDIYPDILIGARNSNALFDMTKYKLSGNVFLTTEDGSTGEQGFVTQHSVFQDLTKYNHICTCGPNAMMKTVARAAHQNHVHCEASLENTMACGIGACLCCVTETTDGHRRCVCTEGPVFDTKTLIFQ
jgi:dihydroorotate dehydrogenase electron transfer subunit